MILPGEYIVYSQGSISFKKLPTFSRRYLMPFPHVKMKQRREELSLTRKQLAEKCGVPERHIEAMEQGRKVNPTLDTLESLCKGLEVDCTFFFVALDAEQPPPVVGRPPKAKPDAGAKGGKAKGK